MGEAVVVTADERVFEDSVKREEAKGISRQAAISKVAARDPEMHRKYLAAYNARVRGDKGGAAPAPRVTDMHAALPNATAEEILAFVEAGTPVAVAAWEWNVAQGEKRGLSSRAAVREVVEKSPAIYEAYVKAYNELHGNKRVRR